MPEGWRTVALSEVAELDIRRVIVDPSRRYRIAGVLNSGQGLFERGEISGAETNYPAFHVLVAGQVVMRKLTAWEGPVAIVPKVFEGYCVSTEFPTFTLDRFALLPEYMAIICQHPPFWQSLRDRSTGTVQRRKRVSPKQFLSVPVRLPPVSEQRRIVDLMRGIDHGLKSTNRLRDASLIVRASLADDLIFGRSDESSLTVRDLAVERGLIGGPFGSSLVRKDYVSEGVPVIRGQNMSGDSRYVAGKFAYVSDDKAKELQRNQAQPGDVVFTQRGTLGQVALVPEEPHDRYVISQSQMRLRTDPAVALPEYVFHVFRTQRIVNEVVGRNTATANPHINLGILAGIVIPVPPLDQQRRTARLLEKASAVVEAGTQEEEALRRTRSALLEDLLSGSHRVPDSYDDLLEGAG